MAGPAVAMDDDGMMAEGPAIAVGGSAKLGLVYSGQKKTGDRVDMEPRTSFHSEVDIEFTGQGVTDGGLTFGATATAEFRSGGASAPAPDVFIGGDMWKIIIGSPKQATDDLAFSLNDIGFTGLGVDDIAEEPFKLKDSAQARFELTLGVATVAVTVGQTNGKAVSEGTERKGTLTDGGLNLSAGQTISFAAEPGTFPIGSTKTNNAATITAQTNGAFFQQFVTRTYVVEGEDDPSHYFTKAHLIDALEKRDGFFDADNDGEIEADETDRLGLIIDSGAVKFASVQVTPNSNELFEGTTRVRQIRILTGFKRNDDDDGWVTSGGAPVTAPKTVAALDEYASYFDLGDDKGVGGSDDELSAEGRQKLAAMDADVLNKLLKDAVTINTEDDGYVKPEPELTRTIAEGSDIADQKGTVTWVEGAVAKATKSKTHWTAGVKADLGPVTFGLGVDSNDSILANVGGDMGQFGGSIFYGRQDGGSTMEDLTALGAEVKVTAAEGTTVNAVYAQAERGTAKSDGFGLGVTHALGGGANVEAGFAQVNDQDKFSVGVAMKF